MSEWPVVALCAVVCALAAAFGPRLIGRLRAPDDEADVAAVPVGSGAAGDGPASGTYAELASRPRLALELALAGALAGGIVGWRLGWQPVLAAWLVLTVAGVLLGYVDAQTRLLPTQIIAPAYAVVVVLLVVAAVVDGPQVLVRTVLAWVAMGGFYFVMWYVYPKGLGYGDVRLSGLLGLCLGYLGWGELVTGLYAGFLLGGVVGGVLALLKVVDRRRYPFGPFMLVGALVGLVWGGTLGQWYLLR